MTTHVTFMHTLGLKWVYIAIMPWIMALLCSLLHKECVHSRLLLSFFKVTWWSKISCNVDFQITCLIASEHKGEKGQGPRAPTLFCRTCCSMNLASWQGTFLWISRRALEEKAQLFFFVALWSREAAWLVRTQACLLVQGYIQITRHLYRPELHTCYFSSLCF